ncbi:MAG: ATP-binding domain-containing protein, partial [Aestuariivirga sp.]
HGAKGLEASIVILPDTTSTPKSNAASALMFVDPPVDGPKLPFWRLSGLSQSQAIEDWKNNDKRLELEEQRRLLYVAMTRARDELYVCGYKSKNKLDENSWYALVAEAFPNPNESQGSVAYAEAAPPDSSRVEPNSPAWLFSMPSHPDTQPKSWPPVHARSAGSKAAVARGRAVHKILQDLPEKAPDEWLEFARRRLAKNQLDPGLADRIVNLINIPEHRDFFGEGSQAEVSIGSMAPGGQRRMGRIDRLVIRRDDILLLDYKTDWDVPEALTADHDYVQQLGFYAMALGQAFGGKPIRAAILWTALPRLDWIEAETLQKTISNMAAIT